MVRTLVFALALCVAAPSVVLVATSTSAFAAGEKKLENMKEDVDYHKDRHKAVEKLFDGLTKSVEKEKLDDADEAHKELKEYYKDELASLRAKGVETVEDDEVPADPSRVDKEPEEIPVEKLEELRDIVVALKTLKPSEKPKPYLTKLGEYVKTLQERYERKEKRYEAEKEASK